jgi:hypothetical protein
MEFTLNPDNTYTLKKYTGTEVNVTILNSFEGKPVTALGDGVFANRAITSITLPDTLETIGHYAFYQSGLVSIVLPNSVEFVGKKAFYNCIQLESVTLPTRVFLANDALHNCPKVKVKIY